MSCFEIHKYAHTFVQNFAESDLASLAISLLKRIKAITQKTFCEVQVEYRRA